MAGPGITIRTTGDQQADRTQASTKAALDAIQASVSKLAKAAPTQPGPLAPSGVKPGTYTVAGITSITIDAFGRITEIT